VEDLQKNESMAKLSIPSTQLRGWAISFDHKLLAIADDADYPHRKFLIWDLETNTQICSFRPPLYSWASDFSQDGMHIATYSNDNIVRIWNTANGSLEKSFELGEKPIRAVGFSPDSRFLAVGYERETYEQTGGVILFDVNTGKQETQMLEETAWGVTAVAFSPDGEVLATGNSDGKIKLWRIPEEICSP
jgi:WD40 repeat protein